MQTTGYLIGRIAKFTAGMQDRIDDTDRRDFFGGMQIDRNTATIILNADATILLQCDMYFTAITGEMLVDSIVEDLPDQMMQAT